MAYLAYSPTEGSGKGSLDLLQPVSSWHGNYPPIHTHTQTNMTTYASHNPLNAVTCDITAVRSSSKHANNSNTSKAQKTRTFSITTEISASLTC